ncbi:hypothetical protein ACQ858_14815 [Variovorax ureilyticus]|uniref:hypothetical protein n=1 Tax=Variovorax ureilyticus TaxID=1836198 RepID=UPI003D66BBAA
MEIAQLIYRGRGNYQDEDGNWVSGDKVPRRLVMLVDDYLVESDGEPDPRQWLRQSVDLLTLLVMLRSTIVTRITGDAGLRQSLALVPVGGVGLEELVSLMSQNVTQFVKEADVAWRRIKDQEKVGLIKNAQANIIELFSQTKLQAVMAKADDRRTMVRYGDAKELCDRLPDRCARCLSTPPKAHPSLSTFSSPARLSWKTGATSTKWRSSASRGTRQRSP